jgi:hypothetical protein
MGISWMCRPKGEDGLGGVDHGGWLAIRGSTRNGQHLVSTNLLQFHRAP